MLELSVIVPVYNEKQNIPPLIRAIHAALCAFSYEIILVDDGSFDGTGEAVLSLADPAITLLIFSQNFGQTSALAAGIEVAKGEYILTLDGDLQNDPRDIPMMLATLRRERCDMVAGNRRLRQDAVLLRKIPSAMANYLIRHLTNVHIHDYGCTLKLFTAALAKRLDLYGELHRFIPILAKLQGAHIVEVEVAHHPRQLGTSQYGIGRTFKVISDLLLMMFLQKYRQKPMHLFGTLGCYMVLAGGVAEIAFLLCKIRGIDNMSALFTVGILLWLTAIQLFTTGFLAESVMRTYFEVHRKKPYHVIKRFSGDKELL